MNYSYVDLIDADRALCEAGREYAKVWSTLERYSVLDKNYLAAIKVRLRREFEKNKEKFTEGKLDDQARSDPEWIEFTQKRNKAFDDYGYYRVRYDTAIKHHESVRSALSYQKKEMELR